MKQDLDFCSKCGQLSGHIKATLCPSCFESERNDYNRIREYLKSSPRSNAMEIAKATGIPINKITKYIKDNSLIISD